jgi:hypothetical protein
MVTKSWIGCGLAGNLAILACLVLLPAGSLAAQELIAPKSGGAVRLMPSDSAILESTENRKDLPCTVTPDKPSLGFDLKFHVGYEVSVPLKELAGSENQLTMVFRVTSENSPNKDAAYFSQHIAVPAIDSDEGGPAYLEGAFNVGEGKYHVDWLMRDRAERMCSFHWDADANLSARDKPMTLDIPGGTVQALDPEIFKPESPIQRQPKPEPFNVKVMVNFAPQDANSAALQPLDTGALLSVLRSISREPRICKFSIVAYNMQQQKVIYRQDNAPQIDFPALGKAIKSLHLGTVDLKHLTQKHSDTDFLTQLMSTEIKEDPKDSLDALIFAGPKVMLDDGLAPETLKQFSDVKFPVFYLNYNANPQANPWRDAIGNAVRFLKGAEYTISRPRDLFFAWTEIMGRIVKSKQGRSATVDAAWQ